jgi:sugar phosphate isomerase/epimerase
MTGVVKMEEKYVSKKENQYGIVEWCLALNGPSAIKMAGDMGFDGIQLGELGGAAAGFALNDPYIREQYLEAAASSGVKLHSLHTHSLTREGGMRYPKNSAKGAEAIVSFTEALKACRALSIDKILVASFAASNVANDYDMKNTAIMLNHFLELAQDQGVELLYEPVTGLDRILYILDCVKDEIKLCYDVLNPLRFGFGNPIAELPKIGLDRIDHIHLKEMPENTVGCCPFEAGAGNVKKTIELLKTMGYKGWYHMEQYYYQDVFKSLGHGFELAEADLAWVKAAVER